MSGVLGPCFVFESMRPRLGWESTECIVQDGRRKTALTILTLAGFGGVS